jgi:hypothetical protein
MVSTAADARAAPAAGPAETTTKLIDALNALDPARFDRFFAPDVTMFFPQGPFAAGRIEGKAAVTGNFHHFFDRSGAAAPTTST